MEFREYYRGVCARIHYDHLTSNYIGEIEGLGQNLSFVASAYADAQQVFQQAVDDHLARSAKGVQNIGLDAAESTHTDLTPKADSKG